MRFLDKFLRRERQPESSRTQEEIEQAQRSEPKNYLTICQKIFKSQATRQTLPITYDDSLSGLDKMVFPHVVAGIMTGRLECNESCPGYVPLPDSIEPFRVSPNREDYVMCQRYVPKDVLEKYGSWQQFRDHCIGQK